MSNVDTELDDFENDIGLDPEDKKHARDDQQKDFKGEKGRTYRASIVYFHPLEVAVARAAKKKAAKDGQQISAEALQEAVKKVLTKRADELGKPLDQLKPWEKLDLNHAQFKKILAFYKEGLGFVMSRLGKDGAEADEVWKTLGDEPKVYFRTALLLYPTNREGELIREEFAGGWKVQPWRFANKVYQRLHQVTDALRANDLSIADQDLSLKCTNTEYQNFDIDGAGKALWRRDPKFSTKVLEKAYGLYEKIGKPFRELSTADLRLKLGMSSGSSSSSEDVDMNEFSSLLDGV